MIAIRWIAALSCRFPVLLSRWRGLLLDQTGKGAVPLCRAKACLDRKRRTSAVSPMILAAVSVAQPQMSSKVGASCLTVVWSSSSRAWIWWVSRRQSSISVRASLVTTLSNRPAEPRWR